MEPAFVLPQLAQVVLSNDTKAGDIPRMRPNSSLRIRVNFGINLVESTQLCC